MRMRFFGDGRFGPVEQHLAVVHGFLEATVRLQVFLVVGNDGLHDPADVVLFLLRERLELRSFSGAGPSQEDLLGPLLVGVVARDGDHVDLMLLLPQSGPEASRGRLPKREAPCRYPGPGSQ